MLHHWNMYIPRGWCPKFASGLNIMIRHSSKSIWLTNLLFSQNDSTIKRSFWQKDSLVTHILFELHMPIMIFCPVVKFGHHPLGISFFPDDVCVPTSITCFQIEPSLPKFFEKPFWKTFLSIYLLNFFNK